MSAPGDLPTNDSSEILNDLPCAVLELGRDGKVARLWGHPATVSKLPTPLEGKNLKEGLFLNDWDKLPNLQREILLDLGKSIGDPLLIADLLASQLPASVRANEQSFTINYSFADRGGMVGHIFLLLVPTSNALAPPKSEGSAQADIPIQSSAERSDVELVLQLHRCDLNVYHAAEGEVTAALAQLKSISDRSDDESLDQYRKLFHSIKGSTAQLGLKAISTLAREAEFEMKDALKAQLKSGDFSKIQARIQELGTQWARILAIKPWIQRN
jgi:hypothetical protein